MFVGYQISEKNLHITFQSSCLILELIINYSFQYLQRGGSKLAEQQRRLKSQIWSSIVTIVLVEGKDLQPMDPDGFSDPYVKFK